jgi:hypothetical protein
VAPLVILSVVVAYVATLGLTAKRGHADPDPAPARPQAATTAGLPVWGVMLRPAEAFVGRGTVGP